MSLKQLVTFIFGLVLVVNSEAFAATSHKAAVRIIPGVKGTLMYAPQCGNVPIGGGCPQTPYSGDFDIVNDSGVVVSSGASDSSGNFSLPLAPGKYMLRVSQSLREYCSAALMASNLQEFWFSVKRKSVTTVNFTLQPLFLAY